MSEMSSEKFADQRIIFFDGVCHVCNVFIDFLLKRDASGRLMFAPLQGSTAAQALGSATSMNSVIYFRLGQRFEESTAVLMILKDLGGLWSLLGSLGFIFPLFFRDAVYRLIARNRYSIFGQREACRMPTAEERSHFLD